MSFKLGEEIEKVVFRLVTTVEQRKKFWAPISNRTSDLPTPRCSTTEPLRLYYEVNVWHVSCIPLGSAMSIASCFVDRIIRKMVSFKLDREIGKDVFRLVTSVGQKKFWVPMRNLTLDLRTSADPSSMQDACHMWTSTSSQKKAYKSDSSVLERMILQ